MRLSLLLLMVLPSAVLAEQLPIRSGQYVFQHRFAEQPTLASISLIAIVKGRHITLINKLESGVFPKGVIAEGTLLWHPSTRQWIVGRDESDRNAQAVGGCSDGPEVIDLKQKIYWTC